MSESRFEDIIYETTNGVATITINRPEKLNAFRMQTYEEVIEALKLAGWDRNVGVIVLTGAGGKAFGVGGDTSDKNQHFALVVPDRSQDLSHQGVHDRFLYRSTEVDQ